MGQYSKRPRSPKAKIPKGPNPERNEIIRKLMWEIISQNSEKFPLSPPSEGTIVEITMTLLTSVIVL